MEEQPYDREEIEKKAKDALKTLSKQFLKGKEFSIRKQANAITVKCFRNTVLENYHCRAFIYDNEMKNLNIETSARIEYMLNNGTFDTKTPAQVFEFAFIRSYKHNVKKDLKKDMWKALKKESYEKIRNLQYAKKGIPNAYLASLLLEYGFYATYYDEDIKFNGKELTGDPNSIKVGHQHLNETELKSEGS